MMSKKRVFFFRALIIIGMLVLLLALVYQFSQYEQSQFPIYQHDLLMIVLKCNIIKKVFAI